MNNSINNQRLKQLFPRPSHISLTLILFLFLGSAYAQITPASKSPMTIAEADLMFDAGSAATKSASITTTNTLVTRTADSYPGYTLYAPLWFHTTYLIDHFGEIVYSWPSKYFPNGTAYLMDDGSILRSGRGDDARFEHIDKNGEVLWSWIPSDPDLLLHHDIEPLPNGNIIMVAREIVTAEEAIANGRDPSQINAEIWPDLLIEVEPTGPTSGTIVWKWRVMDHLIQDFDPDKLNYGVVADHPELVDINHIDGPTLEDWLHANGVDYNADLDQLVFSIRSNNEFWVIDHSTTMAESEGHSGGNGGRGGDLLYRWGNPTVYGAPGERVLFRQHDARWIEKGYPGEGNFMVFNNGLERPEEYSSVEEIVPPLDGYNYTLTPGAAWGPTTTTWSYSATPKSDFYSIIISGADRLPNGNTFICDGVAGRFFEVTPSGEVVWDYRNPFYNSGVALAQSGAFRATRFGIDSTPIIALGLNKENTGDYTYPVVDTNQTLLYDNLTEIAEPDPGENFYGQDAQYKGHQPHYTLSDDRLTVFDNVTSLTWMRDPDLNEDETIDINDKVTYGEGQSIAADLNAKNYGGINTWRVPTIKELYSLIDFSGTDPMIAGPMTTDTTSLKPFIDTAYFDFAYGDTNAGERVIDSQWLTNTLYVDNNNMMFGVNFADGRIKGYGLNPPMGEKKFYVRLCSGNPDYGINSFANNGNGTITDNATGLMWTQNDSGPQVNPENPTGTNGPRSGMNWQAALAWVEQKNAKNYLGHNDWRLPNAKELQSILDYTRSPGTSGSAAIDSVFNATQITNEAGQTDYPWYWTGTTHVREDGAGESGVYLCFGRGLGYMNGGWVDIHGAGAQRSDQKGGDFTGYTYEPDGYYRGNAPQGDAARIYNYVRLVRDAEPPLNIDAWLMK